MSIRSALSGTTAPAPRRSRGLLLSMAGCLLALTACSGDSESAEQPSADNEKQALTSATEACEVAMTRGVDLDTMRETRSDAADKAAQANVLNDQWDDLADVLSDWSTLSERSAELMEGDNFEEASLSDLEELNDDIIDIRSDVLSECRTVVAAGGEIDEDLFTEFNNTDDS